MLKGSEITAAIVTKLQLISALVAALGDRERIYAYTDSFSDSTNIFDALFAMKRPAVMVAWDSTTLPRNRWEHAIDIYIMPGTESSSAAISDAIIDGTATGDPLRFYDMRLHSSCDPMQFRSLSRVPLAVRPDAVIEYFKLSFTLAEIGG